MALAHSKVTTQGQISVSAEVRRRLGVGPGSVLEWDEEGENILVRRLACYASTDIHHALFPKQARMPKTLDEMQQGIKRRLRERHARR